MALIAAISCRMTKPLPCRLPQSWCKAPDEDSLIDEDGLFARERAAFIRLAKTPETHARISAMLDDGAPGSQLDLLCQTG
jgi:hypothetical protein